MPMNASIAFLIYQPDFNEETLDFILGASNITENIIVIFAEEGVKQLPCFKALKGFNIEKIYAEKESLDRYSISPENSTFQFLAISRDRVKHYASHCQQIFAF